jgi:hypothetical protein
MITTDNRILYCRACEKRFQVLQHFNTNIHKENIKIKSTISAPVQKLLSEFSQGYGGGIRTHLHSDSQSQSQSYFTTGCLPPVSSSWRQGP